MKSYRFYGDEMEALGQRLDSARCSLANSTTSWSKNYWTQVVEQLLTQWQHLPILHDGGAQMTIIPKWTIDYDYYEIGHKNEGFSISDRAYHKLVGKSPNLDSSWHNHREARLAKAQY